MKNISFPFPSNFKTPPSKILALAHRSTADEGPRPNDPAVASSKTRNARSSHFGSGISDPVTSGTPRRRDRTRAARAARTSPTWESKHRYLHFRAAEKTIFLSTFSRLLSRNEDDTSVNALFREKFALEHVSDAEIWEKPPNTTRSAVRPAPSCRRMRVEWKPRIAMACIKAPRSVCGSVDDVKTESTRSTVQVKFGKTGKNGDFSRLFSIFPGRLFFLRERLVAAHVR